MRRVIVRRTVSRTVWGRGRMLKMYLSQGRAAVIVLEAMGKM
jgi:hypothetical protein